MSGWANSDRRDRLPSDWKKRVAATKRRAGGLCEGISLNGETPWHVAQCDGIGTDCDHHERGDNHELTNLRWLSGPCHDHKTVAEREAARPKVRRGRRHPSEAPPGGDPPRGPRALP